jgi:hypothetical protein
MGFEGSGMHASRRGKKRVSGQCWNGRVEREGWSIIDSPARSLEVVD